MNGIASDLILTLTDPPAARRYTLTVSPGAATAELARALLAARQLPPSAPGLVIGDLFRGPQPSIYFYYPRRGVLDANRSVAQNGVTPLEDLYFYQPDPLPTGLADIPLGYGRSLAEDAILLVVEYHQRHYPIVVPRHLGRGASGAAGLLGEIVTRQLADLGVVTAPDPADPATVLLSARTGQSLTLAGAPADLAALFRHGDLVYLRGAGDSLPAPTPQALIDAIELEGEGRPFADQVELFTDDIEIEDPLASQIVIGDPGGTTVAQSAQRKTLTIGQTTLELLRGDITHQATDAIVNAANSSLAGGGGVDGVIHAAAGPELARASRALAPCLPGRAVLTPGYRLPARWVIHTVGPRYHDGQQGEPDILAQAYISSLTIARDSGFQSIAFPSISTGIYSYPMNEAAAIALKTCADWLREHGAPALVRFVFVTDAGFATYAAALDRLAAAPPAVPLPAAPPAATAPLPADDEVEPFFTTEEGQ
jgi:O-acetyl-ADP-ribose deacetylase (regulator of RNase III)